MLQMTRNRLVVIGGAALLVVAAVIAGVVLIGGSDEEGDKGDTTRVSATLNNAATLPVANVVATFQIDEGWTREQVGNSYALADSEATLDKVGIVNATYTDEQFLIVVAIDDSDRARETGNPESYIQTTAELSFIPGTAVDSPRRFGAGWKVGYQGEEAQGFLYARRFGAVYLTVLASARRADLIEAAGDAVFRSAAVNEVSSGHSYDVEVSGAITARGTTADQPISDVTPAVTLLAGSEDTAARYEIGVNAVATAVEGIERPVETVQVRLIFSTELTPGRYEVIGDLGASFGTERAFVMLVVPVGGAPQFNVNVTGSLTLLATDDVLSVEFDFRAEADDGSGLAVQVSGAARNLPPAGGE